MNLTNLITTKLTLSTDQLIELVNESLADSGFRVKTLSYEQSYDSAPTGIVTELEGFKVTPELFMRNWIVQNDPERRQFIQAIKATREAFRGLSLVEANDIRKKLYAVL